MATYKAIMGAALGYASSIWSHLAFASSINKLKVMQNAALRTATGCTEDTNIQHLHDDTLILPNTHAQYIQKHNINHTPYTNIQDTSTFQGLKTLSLTTAVTQQTFQHNHYNRHTNKPALYTYIYCLYASSHKRQ